MTKQITDEAIRAIVHDLKDFGYPVDFAYCRKAVDGILEGKPAMSLGTPALFIEKMLLDAGLIPDQES